MRGILKAIGAALAAAVAVVVEKCRITGRWIARVISTPMMGGGGGGGYEEGVDDYAEVEPPVGMQHVRDLAAAISSGSVRPDMLEQVSEDVFEWLSVLDRKMLTRIVMSDDEKLRAHIRGNGVIKGVVAADTESVKAYRRAISVRHVDEHSDDYEPELAFA